MSLIKVTNNSQRISPPNTAQSNLKAIRIRSANLPKLIRIPAEWETHAGDNHRDRCKMYNKTFAVNITDKVLEQ